MSLLNTKPRWFKGEVIATKSGWVNPANNEVLVAIGNLKAKLEAEGVSFDAPVENIKVEVNTMNEQVEEVKVKRAYNKKPKVIGEVTEQVPQEGQQVIAEVVEYSVDTQVVGE